MKVREGFKGTLVSFAIGFSSFDWFRKQRVICHKVRVSNGHEWSKVVAVV